MRVLSARLVARIVHLQARMAPEDDEINARTILTCQAVAITPELSFSCDGCVAIAVGH